jgi:hypothetical protein
MNTFEEILRTALALPEEQRAILAGRLRRTNRLESLDKPIRLSRLNIFLFDFHEARRFADYILTRDLHKSKDPQSKTRLVHLAFNTSLIVSYCRPFHGSNDQKGARKVSLSQGHLVTVLNARTTFIAELLRSAIRHSRIQILSLPKSKGGITPER